MGQQPTLFEMAATLFEAFFGFVIGVIGLGSASQAAAAGYGVGSPHALALGMFLALSGFVLVTHAAGRALRWK